MVHIYNSLTPTTGHQQVIGLSEI